MNNFDTKRLGDIIFSTLFLLLLAPIFVPVILLLVVTGEGDVFYRQQRVGMNQRVFNMIKFATMLRNSEQTGNGGLTIRNDPRVTSVGKWLRASKINEMPQLLNVLRGDMSVVGPRPQPLADFDIYSNEMKTAISEIRPGLTGIGSILFRDEERIFENSELSPRECYEREIAPYKGELEVWYVENRSILIDISIIFLTLIALFRPDYVALLAMKLFPNLPSPRNVNNVVDNE